MEEEEAESKKVKVESRSRRTFSLLPESTDETRLIEGMEREGKKIYGKSFKPRRKQKTKEQK